MISEQDKKNISLLIKKDAAGVSTESLICFIAEHDGLLASYKKVLYEAQNSDKAVLAWLEAECLKHRTTLQRFCNNLAHILEILQPDATLEESYHILGLEIDANDTEIKQAYRRLSLRYHPDRANGNKQGDAEKFIAISTAYNKVLASRTSTSGYNSQQISHPWRYNKPSRITSQQKKNSFLIIGAMTIILLGLTLLAPYIYKKNIIFKASGYHNHSTHNNATIPVVTTSPVAPDLKAINAGEQDISNTPSARLPLKEQVISDKSVQIDQCKDTLQSTEVSSLAPEKILSQPTELKYTSTHLKTFEKISKTSSQKIKRSVSASKKKSKPEILSAVQKSFINNKVQGMSGQPEVSKTISAPPIQTHDSELSDDQVLSDHLLETTIPQREAIPEKTLSSSLETKQKILSFLMQYTKCYIQKDLDGFSKLFTEDAVENGTPFSEMIPTYTKLFNQVKTLSFSTDIISWNTIQDKILLTCAFDLILNYRNHSTSKFSGTVEFVLAKENDTSKIQKLSYWFDK